MDLEFEPTATEPKAWTVRDGGTGEVIGCVAWLDRLGAYGFGVMPARSFVSPFKRADMMFEIGRFLDQVNAA